MNAIVDALYKLGNNETIKKKVHPDVCWQMPLDKWMIERTLYCINLLQEEWNEFRLRE